MIFVPLCYLDDVVGAVAGTAICVGIPIGFSLGGHTTKTKSPKLLKWSRTARKRWTWSCM